MAELKKRPVIIDCDPGVDDAVAIFMMMADEQFDILGITPVNGNKPLENSEKNSLMLCELAGKEDIPVLHGAHKAVFAEGRTAGAIHGASGLGGVVLPEPKKQLETEYAWDFIYRQAVAHEGELEILAIGPLTNLAVALLKYPDLPQYVKQIVIMGGGISTGNMTASGEFNIWADADAAKIVFKSGIQMVMIGLEVCMEGRIMGDEVAALRANGGPVSLVAAQLIGEREVRSEGKGAVLCDALASAYMIDPSIMTNVFDAVVDVETSGFLTEGRTVAKRIYREFAKEKPNTIVCWHIDRPRLAQMIIDLCKKLDDQLK